MVFAILFVALFLLCIYFYRSRIWFLGDKKYGRVSKSTKKIYYSKRPLDRQDIRRFVAELGVTSLGQIVGQRLHNIGLGGNLESSM